MYEAKSSPHKSRSLKSQNSFSWLSSRMRHLRRPHQLVEPRAAQVSEFQARVPQAEPLRVSRVRDLGGFIVTDLGTQSRHQHQRIAHVFVDLGAVQRDSADHVIHKSKAGIVYQRDRVQKIVNQHRLENVQLERSEEHTSELQSHV